MKCVKALPQQNLFPEKTDGSLTSLEVLWLQFSDEWILTDCLCLAGTSCLCRATSCYVVAPSVCVWQTGHCFSAALQLCLFVYMKRVPPPPASSSFHMEVCVGEGVLVPAHLGEGHTLRGAPGAEGCHYPADWMGALYRRWGEWAGLVWAASSSLSSRLEQETFQTGDVGSVFCFLFFLKWSFHLCPKREQIVVVVKLIRFQTNNSQLHSFQRLIKSTRPAGISLFFCFAGHVV